MSTEIDITKFTSEELEKILLTVDGQGKTTKKAVFRELLRRALSQVRDEINKEEVKT